MSASLSFLIKLLIRNPKGRGLRMEPSPGLRQCLDVRDVTT